MTIHPILFAQINIELKKLDNTNEYKKAKINNNQIVLHRNMLNNLESFKLYLNMEKSALRANKELEIKLNFEEEGNYLIYLTSNKIFISDNSEKFVLKFFVIVNTLKLKTISKSLEELNINEAKMTELRKGIYFNVTKINNYDKEYELVEKNFKFKGNTIAFGYIEPLFEENSKNDYEKYNLAENKNPEEEKEKPLKKRQNVRD
ncbi:hypothetical protein ACQ4LE_010958 [Meloidogyne hapla]